MKQILFVNLQLLYILLFHATPNVPPSPGDCILQPPLLQIDFGSRDRSMEVVFSSTENYDRVYANCPEDGNYAIVPSTSDCFGSHWITINQDHTPNDIEGKMLLVNAAYRPGLFFVTSLKDLSPNTTYELGAWLVNVCRAGFNCTPIRPDLRFIIENTAGKELAKFSTGELTPTGTASWMQYSALFKTPAIVGTLSLKVETKPDGGCGNDFAIDDITIRECIVPEPPVKEVPKTKAVIKKNIPAPKPVFKAAPPVGTPVKKGLPVTIQTSLADSLVVVRPVKIPAPKILIPAPILTRTNPIIQQIKTVAAELLINLYDNGEIDGDTVSIYHNNNLIVSRAGLSQKPVTFSIAVDALHPHHELVMVANNLGSIPPNTSLMIITAKDKRYEVFISSSEQKNAKVLIDLEE
ncbi:MAG: hypothetical protein H7Z13_18135 [Ferruginibacter sp.]|nr:hypothetical protein [Ferruginibacter sp.]